MTTIKTVTQEEMKQKFNDFAQNILGTKLDKSHVAVVSTRTQSNISVIDNTNLLSMLKEKGFSMPENMEDIAVVSVVETANKNITSKKMRR